MKKIGVFYGSDSGNTQHIAQLIAKSLQIDSANIYDIGSTSLEKMRDYDCLLLGSSTSGFGDIQDDWELTKLADLDLHGKQVAVFGTGDSFSYSDTFCGAIGQLAAAAQKAGATLIGNKVDASGYSHDTSDSEKEGYFCGLAIDEDNESDQTDARIKSWIEQLAQATVE